MNTRLNQARVALQKHTPQLFFGLLLGLFIMGEGKQSMTEAIVGVGVLLMYVSVRSRTRRPPFPLGALWVVVMVVGLLRTVFSDSLGYSISALVRLGEGFLIFKTLFYWGKRRNGATYALLLVWTGTTAVFVLLVLTVFNIPLTAGGSMSLLYATGGHSYLAGLLLFVLPSAVVYHQQTNTPGPYLLFALLVGLVVAFARGALVLGGSFLLALALLHRGVDSQGKRIFLGLVGTTFIVVATTVIVVSALIQAETTDTSSSWFLRQTVKYPLYNNERLGYWQQAITAIRERPWFGSGPGTYPLQSLRLQTVDHPAAASAHSYLLETMVEYGTTGAFPVFFLIVLSLLVSEKAEKWNRGLFWGAVLTVVYGLVERNLNILPLWFLFWGTTGYLVSQSPSATSTGHKSPQWPELITATFVLLFSASSILNTMLVLTKGGARLALWVAPYSQPVVAARLDLAVDSSEPLTKTEDALVRLFHGRTPETLFKLAETRRETRRGEAGGLYQAAIRGNPINAYYYYRYLSYLLEQDNKTEAGKVIKNMLTVYATEDALRSENLGNIPPTTIANELTLTAISPLANAPNLRQAAGKLYYLLGINLLDGDPATAKQLWSVALALSPEWEYYHAELASLELYTFRNPVEARLILARCQTHYYPARTCKFWNNNLSSLRPPGFYREAIIQIPAAPKP